MHPIRWTPLLATLALAACGAHAAGPDLGTPSVHELARLQSTGALDAPRMQCVTEALLPVIREIPGTMAEIREAEANVAAIAMDDHAWSVQQGMLTGDAMNDAARQRASDLRHATRLAEQGSTRAAGSIRWHSANLAARAEEIAGVLIGQSPGQRIAWSEEDALLLVEYAELITRRANGTGDVAPTSARIAEIEDSHPAVMEGYAAALLALHRAPDLECNPPA